MWKEDCTWGAIPWEYLRSPWFHLQCHFHPSHHEIQGSTWPLCKSRTGRIKRPGPKKRKRPVKSFPEARHVEPCWAAIVHLFQCERWSIQFWRCCLPLLRSKSCALLCQTYWHTVHFLTHPPSQYLLLPPFGKKSFSKLTSCIRSRRKARSIRECYVFFCQEKQFNPIVFVGIALQGDVHYFTNQGLLGQPSNHNQTIDIHWLILEQTECQKSTKSILTSSFHSKPRNNNPQIHGWLL